MLERNGDGAVPASPDPRHLVKRFHAAVRDNRVEVVRELLANNPQLDPNAPLDDWWDYPVLVWVASDKDDVRSDMLELLLSDPRTDVNAVPDDGLTPLMMAAVEGTHYAVGQILAHSDVDVGRRNRFGRHALYYACATGDFGSAELLLCRMIREGLDLELVYEDVDLNTDPVLVPLDDMVEFMLQLLETMEYRLPIPRWLIRTDPASRTLEQALALASHSGTHQEVLALLERGADPDHADEAGVTSLMLACAQGGNRKAIVATLLEWSTDPNARDRLGRTSYYFACSVNCSETLAVMHLDPRIDISIADKSGTKPEDAEIELLRIANNPTRASVQAERERRKREAESEACRRRTLERREALALKRALSSPTADRTAKRRRTPVANNPLPIQPPEPEDIDDLAARLEAETAEFERQQAELAAKAARLAEQKRLLARRILESEVRRDLDALEKLRENLTNEEADGLSRRAREAELFEEQQKQEAEAFAQRQRQAAEAFAAQQREEAEVEAGRISDRRSEFDEKEAEIRGRLQQ
ncbi:ankyrin repeat-containing domain protein [Hyaloraphidium curvatum]|nr:ankyrin repeat-containing domain protein [Hyaloraphidium curvatum]